MATLQRINQALILQLMAQQEANQISQAYALQQIVAQKQQQDALKATFFSRPISSSPAITRSRRRMPALPQRCGTNQDRERGRLWIS